jgi:hypothetical protein
MQGMYIQLVIGLDWHGGELHRGLTNVPGLTWCRKPFQSKEE